MPDYSKGKVYKITNGDLTYIGSTTTGLAQRLAQHKYDKNGYDAGKNNKNLTSFQLLQDANAVITLLEDFPCERREQLTARERFYIESSNCVNKYIPSRTITEYNHDAEVIKRKNEWSKLKMRELRKDKTFREKFNASFKKWSEMNNDKLKAKVICECGGCFTHRHQSTHFKTSKHKTHIDKNNNINLI